MDDQQRMTPSPIPEGWRDDATNLMRGMLMGGADVIPGVSGGTVALIVGIYPRLVTAISHFDRHLVQCLLQRQWRRAADHIDLRFLGFLLTGIALGVVSLGGLMNQLLSSSATRGQTLSAFFGLILGSTVIVARMVRITRPAGIYASVVLGVAGAACAFWVTGLRPIGGETTLAYIFVCGVIGICAMVLPGISGAYLLLILGVYMHLTGILRSLRHMQITGTEVATVVVFGAGCAVGIISFSKALRWMLTHFQAQTMAVLSGFMVGALRKIWPFQQPVGPLEDGLRHPTYRNVFPDTLDGHVILCVAIAVAGGIAVLLLDRSRKQSQHSVFR